MVLRIEGDFSTLSQYGIHQKSSARKGLYPCPGRGVNGSTGERAITG